MSTLADRLADLADDAVPARPPGGGAEVLWHRGRRRRRHQRWSTVAICIMASAMLVVLVGTAVPALRPKPPVPTSSSGTAGIPREVFRPSPSLPGTDELGPLGPLALIGWAERDGLAKTSQTEPFGVSSITGDYRFLDLPGLAGLGAYALSPDGRFIGYWTTDPRDDNTSGGFALYDTTSGKVETAAFPSQFGVSPNGLDWISDSTVVMTYLAEDRPPTDDGTTHSSSGPAQSLTWNTDDDRPVRLEDSSPLADISGADPGSGIVAGSSLGRTTRVFERDTGAVTARVPSIREIRYSTTLPDPTGTALAVILGNDPVPRRVSIVGSDGRTPVPESGDVTALLGWLDESHLVVSGERDADPDVAVWSLDVRTGATRDMVTTDASSLEGAVSFEPATDLLSQPLAAAHRPPDTPDRRLALALAAGVTFLTALGLIWAWRRRVRV